MFVFVGINKEKKNEGETKDAVSVSQANLIVETLST